MAAEVSNTKSQAECFEEILERSFECYEFFTGEKYEIDHEDFKYQQKQLVIMSYMQLNFFADILRLDARRLDTAKKENTSTRTDFVQLLQDLMGKFANSHGDKQEPVVPEVEYADPPLTGETLSTTSTGPKEMSSTLSDCEDSFSFPDDPETSVSTSEGAQDPGTIKEADSVIRKVLKFIKTVAPNLRYKPKHLRRKKFKVVPYEFASVWRNVSSIFSEEEESPSSSMDTIVPKVSWEKVNVAALKKLPTPSSFPVQTASPQSQFYSKDDGCPRGCTQIQFEYFSGDPRKIPCKCRLGFEETNPFGTLLGFQSNLGVVPVPSTPMFGHIWDPDTCSWLLHAEIPSPGNISSSELQQDQWRRGRSFSGRRTRGRKRRR